MINNEFYDSLDEGWYTACNHPIALLRAENKLRIPWIVEEMHRKFSRTISFLDIGCGAGMLTNAIAKIGHKVTGIDLSERSLKIAREKDATGSVDYKMANGYFLPFEDASYEIVSALDVLEHVEEPAKIIKEASRVLKPGGLFFFHTFNRNFFSYFFVIKGVEWCVKNTPQNMHIYPLFIKPKELKNVCDAHGLFIQTLRGVRPKFTLPFWKMVMTRKVPENFEFCFSKGVLGGYSGIALKKEI